MFAAPNPTVSVEDREYIKPRDLVGHLLILKPTEHKTGIQTKFGEKDGIILHVVDLSAAGDNGLPGKIHLGQMWLSGFIVGSLKTQIGQLVLAIMYTEPSNKGNDAFKLQDATTNPQYVQAAETWMAANPSAFSELAAPVVAQAAPIAAVQVAPVVAQAPPAMAAVPAGPAAVLDMSVINQLDPAMQQQLMAQLSAQKQAQAAAGYPAT